MESIEFVEGEGNAKVSSDADPDHFGNCRAPSGGNHDPEKSRKSKFFTDTGVEQHSDDMIAQSTEFEEKLLLARDWQRTVHVRRQATVLRAHNPILVGCKYSLHESMSCPQL